MDTTARRTDERSEIGNLLPDGERIGGVEAPVSGETEPIVLSRGNLFCVVTRRGDIMPAGARDLGLFHDDTRHLSHLEFAVDGGPATVLSSETSASWMSQIDLTLTDRHFGGFFADPQNSLHIRRRQLLDDLLVERVAITNYLRRALDVRFTVRFDADFADIFEVRGVKRTRRGKRLPPDVTRERVVLAYDGIDGTRYRTVVRLLPAPTAVTVARAGGVEASYQLHFQPGETMVLELSVQPLRGDVPEPPWQPFDVRSTKLKQARHDFIEGATRVRCDNNRFETYLARAMSDVDSLHLRVGGHGIIGAGIPWFAAPFGRDSIITSLEVLSVAPHLAVETLHTLAAYQGERVDDWREEEPGKIMHELRRGELARAGEVPHSPYYGTIDATPLWLILLGEAWRWTGDDSILSDLMSHAERALAWIEQKLDEGGGFVRYRRKHKKALENQGWKDSFDGVSFPDGTIAEAPIALVEVQGYVVAALEWMARLRRQGGDAAGAHALREQASALRRRIDERFWLDDAHFYALALDGRDRVVPTLTSNPGHLGFCRAYVDATRADRVAEMIMSDGMFSGWGVRTLGRGQPVFNPLSYHNGSVWPHDNALVALGLAMNGHVDGTLRIFDGLYAASQHFRDLRLPELFCGMTRGEGDFLVHYPVSCSPQAWASGAFFLLLQASLGLHPDAPASVLTIRNPRLPEFLRWLDLDGMHVGKARVSLHFERTGRRTHVDLVDVAGDESLKVHIEIG